MPIITMSSASLKFYLLSLIFLCALSWSSGMPGTSRRPDCQLTIEEVEQLYLREPPVADERLADAELDIAYNPCKLRNRRDTNLQTKNVQEQSRPS